MENNRERILNLVKKNIVTKITYGAKLEDDYDKKFTLLKELERNKSLFLNSDKDINEANEKKQFVLDILMQLGWSLGFADELVEVEAPTSKKIILSEEKMKAFTDLYDSESYKLEKEINEILYNDSLTGRYSILHSRLKEIKTAKGTSWGKEEVDFVIDKHDAGYTFKAIATILKRPERVVRLKYHANK